MRVATLLPLASALLAALASPARSQDWTFADGFETGTTCAWSLRVGSADPCTPVPMTVLQIRLDATTRLVQLSDVVITGRTVDGRHYWVDDHPISEPDHGLFVFRGASASPLDRSFDLGAHVELTGLSLEFDSTPPGNRRTEIFSGDPVLLGSGSPPVPFGGLPLSTLGAIDAGEPLEGVLVVTSNAIVTATGPDDRLTLSDATGTMVMDDLAFDYSAASYPVGTCFGSVTGVSHLDVVADERLLLPTSAADLVAGPCP